MTERKKVGVRVDADLWKRFKQNVKERKGQTRGVLGDELENAIRHYIRDDTNPTMRQMNERLARIEMAIGTSPADGGTDTFDGEPHTHAPSRVEAAADEKPAANAATEKKIRYLAEQVAGGGEVQQLTRSDLRDVVKDEYGFRADTARRYVDELIDYFDLREHPKNDAVLCSPAAYDRIMSDLRDDHEREATDEMEAIADE